ncbi:MAG: DUF4349 domain-containing protein [Anaerolineae bacterium]|nr:DUF4349 domain-containing protein [Anaerolineae bacterium]
MNIASTPIGAVGTPPPAGPANTSSTGSDSAAKSQQRRLIIKNAEVSMVVADPNATVNKITAWVEENGGWIIESNVVKNGSIQQAVIGVRVPAERLLDALTLIKAEAKTLLSDTVIGTDVTDQYADAQSRLKNLEVAEAQMRTFLEGATNTEEVLKVYEQLVSVRGEIEQIKGRLGYMEQSAAFSSIRVTMQTDPPPTPTTTITPTPEYRGWQLDKVAGDAGNALVFVLQFLISVVVWSVIVVLPTAILVGVPSYLVYRIVNRRKPINKVEGENS